MKKYTDLGIHFLVFLVVLVTLTLAAQRFSGSSTPETISQDNSGQTEGHAITVSQVQSFPHKSYVVLRGYITQSVARENYTFRDSTGEITVKIKDKYWGDLALDSSDKFEILVEIENKIDKAIKVEAKSIRGI